MHLRTATTLIASLVALAITNLAHAVTIDVGTVTLEPDTPRQELQIFVSGGEAVAGVDFFAEILAESAEPSPTFSDLDPNTGIGGVDLLTDTIFGSVPSANQTDSILEPTRLYSIIDATDTTSADGLLATLFVDTTAIQSGSFPLILAGVADGAADTQFFDLSGNEVSTNIINGTIVVNAVVPEPATACFIALTFAMAPRRRRAVK